LLIDCKIALAHYWQRPRSAKEQNESIEAELEAKSEREIERGITS
jgi:hypothetical protein